MFQFDVNLTFHITVAGAIGGFVGSLFGLPVELLVLGFAYPEV